ncbi:putative oxidoreductase (fatty acid repression mutant protein) [Paenibacillus jamilae]|jgi:predicted oxidoreductase (fatty acid repression mutant protein)|uniref:nitroreductase family protein n=1 Tax=Paenibacillus TaxID=44249 RepID=UPI000D316F10|nr:MULTISPECIES: nitroreductase family protein [Paenibacillus]MDP9677122.1 putative oxidoreductase (fatty acid repression mutant protein) [Paenibacillus jamilae]KAF6616791.1 nitroreductase family protein [Paenibacillus sp. EKM101P]KAF6621742.1 nitroreductase family protein [Paenibacillus sp. EKM102P]KAF6630332.1 nitroreductase family protein [Paenibacillus sp. EKM10P]KAF6645583.1 nitroreductase family protein [Paenibacillus sp. EKM11P]
MTKDFFTALKDRRSYYGISKEQVISDQRIQEIVEEAVKYTPTSFNSQTSRAVVLLGEHHDKLWNITEDILREVVGNEEQFKSTTEKMNGFRSGYGTVLFFEDNNVVAGLQQQFEAYADNFPIWANQSNGMLQLVVWTALEQEGLGASLQHYNPLIDEKVKNEWNIPEHWKLIAEMPFGKPTFQPGDKEFQPIEERVKTFK